MNEVLIGRMNEALKAVADSGKPMLIDEVAWLLGSHPDFPRWRGVVVPERIEKLLPEMEKVAEPQAMLRFSKYRNDEDLRGTVCDLAIRLYSR